MNDLNRYLDAAVLKPEMTRAEAEGEIRRSVELGVRTVCVRPCDIGVAKDLCNGTETGVCVVLGFPHGSQLTASKAEEARRYIEAGVDEIDMVANYGWARSGLWNLVRDDIAAVAAVCKPASVPLKVIFETAQLEPGVIAPLVEACVEAGADFVKTSTGFNGAGATDEAVQAMVTAAAGRIRIKPSGGIRDRARALALLAMGTHRLGVGSTSCPAICKGDGSASGEGY